MGTWLQTVLKEIPPKNHLNFELLGTKNSSFNLDLDFIISDNQIVRSTPVAQW